VTREREEDLATIIGTIAWLVALAVLALFFRHDLLRHHTTWWYWSCGIGVVLGLYGLRFAHRRRRTADTAAGADPP